MILRYDLLVCEDYQEVVAVFKGKHPETGEDLVVVRVEHVDDDQCGVGGHEQSTTRHEHRHRSRSGEVGEDLVRPGGEEGVLLRSDLLDEQLVDAGVGVLLERFDVLVEVGADG